MAPGREEAARTQQRREISSSSIVICAPHSWEAETETFCQVCLRSTSWAEMRWGADGDETRARRKSWWLRLYRWYRYTKPPQRGNRVSLTMPVVLLYVSFRNWPRPSPAIDLKLHALGHFCTLPISPTTRYSITSRWRKWHSAQRFRAIFEADGGYTAWQCYILVFFLLFSHCFPQKWSSSFTVVTRRKLIGFDCRAQLLIRKLLSITIVKIRYGLCGAV